MAVGIWIARIGFGAVGDLASGALALGAELQQARRAGVPLEPSYLRPSPPVPPDRNAAPFMRELGELYWALPETERHRTGDLLTAMGSPNRTDTDREIARDWIERQSRILELAETAAARPECDMDRPYEQGYELQFREFAAARDAARLLFLRSMLASDSGRYADAFRDIARGARIGQHV